MILNLNNLISCGFCVKKVVDNRIFPLFWGLKTKIVKKIVEFD